MKVYLFISKEKKQLAMYRPYFESLQQHLDIITSMVDADLVFIIGAWTMKGAQIAKKATNMGIPYIVCPLGDISERNCGNPLMKRKLQTSLYQKDVYKKAMLVIATTPLERDYLLKKGWNKSVQLLRYFGYSGLTTEGAMIENIAETETAVLAEFEKNKAEAISSKTKEEIVAQIMQIESRMAHKNIPLKYLEDLHTLLYADNYDEDAICEELGKLKLKSYAASVFQAMTEKTGLTEGFMPLPAKKGSKSKEILRYIK